MVATKRSPRSKNSSAKNPTAHNSAGSLSTAEFLNRLRKAKELIARIPDPGAALRQSNLGSPLIIYGEDQLRLQRYIAWLGEHLFSKEHRASVVKVFAPELSNAGRLRSFLESLRTTSLFSQCELIVIRDADSLKGANAKSIIEALQNVPENKFVIVSGGETMPQGSLIAGVTAVARVQIVPLIESELKAWIERELKQCGHSAGIAAEALQSIIQSLGNDVGALTQFIEKLVLLVEPSTKIDSQLVSQILIDRPEKSSFELLRAIARRDSLGTAECVSSLLATGSHPLQITAFLSRAYRTLLFKADNPSGITHPDFENAWYWRQLSMNASLFRSDDLKRGIETIACLDRELKGSKLPPELVTALMAQHLVFRNQLAPA